MTFRRVDGDWVPTEMERYGWSDVVRFTKRSPRNVGIGRFLRFVNETLGRSSLPFSKYVSFFFFFFLNVVVCVTNPNISLVSLFCTILTFSFYRVHRSSVDLCTKISFLGSHDSHCSVYSSTVPWSPSLPRDSP